MSSSVRPERPSIEELLGESRPSIESLLRADMPAHSKFTPVQLVNRANRQVANAQDEADLEKTEGRTRALGTVASLARDVPGAEIVQAKLASIVNRKPYPEALRDIRDAEDSAQAYTRIPARMAGGGMAIGAIPGGPALQGARYGLLRGLTNADPTITAKERLHGAAEEGVLDAGAGYLAGKLASAVRGEMARPAPRPASPAARYTPPSAAPRPPAPARPAPAPAAAPTAPDASMTRAEASQGLQKLLQGALDEEGGGQPIFAKGRRLSKDPPTNWGLMERMEAGLKPKGPRVIPRIRPDVTALGLAYP